MNPFLNQTIAIWRKDIKIEIREADHLVALFLFSLLLLVLFNFALNVEPDLMQKTAPGLFWLSVLFASVLTLERSFRRESEEGQWEGLLLQGGDPCALYCGKVLSNLTVVWMVQLFLTPFMIFLFDLPLPLSFLGILFLGSLGVATLGTTYAGLTATLKGGEVLLPTLLFPMLVPLLLAAVQATDLTLTNDLFGQKGVWVELLILFDTVFLLGSLLGAGILFDRGS